MLRRFDSKEQEAHARKVEIALLVVCLCMVTMLAKLWYLQVVKTEELRAKSERNRLRVVRLPAPRGKILDRSGRLLAGVSPIFNICIAKEETGDLEALLKKLGPLLDEPEPRMRTELAKGKREPLYMPIVIKKGVDWKTLCRVEASLYRLPGVYVETVPGRRYPYGAVAPHLLGYLGQVSEEELRANRFPGARSGDLVGKYGIEVVHNQELAGRNGMRRLEVDAMGGLVRVLDQTPPVPGNDLYLTIDLELQRAAQEALEGRSGAVVAMDPQTGAILAMASSPGFDPAAFIKGLTPEEWARLQDKMKRPLLNRAVQGQYAPGSTFKIVTAAAALQEKIITPQTTFFCNSRFRLGRRTFRCWDWRGHGKTNLYKALVQSCDVYFYQVGLKLGIDKLSRYAMAFGLGSPTGIDLPGEVRGRVPTREWKRRTFHEPWQDGETLIVSIGQGAVTVTPLQMADLISAVANGGTLYRPFYLSQVQGPGGGVVTSFEPTPRGRLPVDPAHLRTIRRGLVGAVNDKKGTGRRCRIKGFLVAGKTGTAQVREQKKRGLYKKLPWKYRDHAWFIAYAPARHPKLAVAVLVEHGGHGGSAAAPIARKVFETWIQLQSPRPALAPPRSAQVHQGDAGHA